MSLRAKVLVFSTRCAACDALDAVISTGQPRTVITSRLAKELCLRDGGRMLVRIAGSGCRLREVRVRVGDRIVRRYGAKVVIGRDYLEAVGAVIDFGDGSIACSPSR